MQENWMNQGSIRMQRMQRMQRKRVSIQRKIILLFTQFQKHEPVLSISKILIKKISQLYNIIQCLRKNGNIIFIYCIMKLIR